MRKLYGGAPFWDWIPTPETPAVLFDIETNGLLDATTTVHCICAKTFPDGRVFSFGPQEIPEALAFLSAAPLLVAHNGLCFDIPALHKLFPDVIMPKCFDTLTASRLIWTNLADLDFTRLRSKKRVVFPPKLVGKHSLEAWGYRLGEYKGDYGKVTEHAWDVWTPEMQTYCEQDVEVLDKLFRHILAQEYSPEALALEHEFQQVIFQQEQVGVNFDQVPAQKLYAELAGKRSEQSIILQEEFNPNSRQQIAERLQEKYGWEPSEFTEAGQAKVDEDVLKTLSYPECTSLVEYLELLKIIGMLAEGKNGWLKLVDSDSRIHGRVITNGAVTGRCTHNTPNLAQIPARGDYGKQCRALFSAPKGYVQVGTDASGLELRMFGHYIARYDGGAYVKTILEGDIHTANQQAAGLETRDNAKTFILIARMTWG